MPSPQQIAKDKQGYNPKPLPQFCVNCKHMQTVTDSLDPWKRSDTCTIGKFAVKRNGTCKLFEFKI